MMIRSALQYHSKFSLDILHTTCIDCPKNPFPGMRAMISSPSRKKEPLPLEYEVKSEPFLSFNSSLVSCKASLSVV